MTTRDTPPRTRWVLFAFIAPHAIISWALGALSMATLIAHRPRFEGHGILSLELREWFATGRDGEGVYDYSTTFVRTIFWNAGTRAAGSSAIEELDERHERHERAHIRQFEDSAFTAFWLGLSVASLLWLLGWHAEAWQPAVVWLLVWLSGPLWLIGNWATALLRFRLVDSGESWVRRAFNIAYNRCEHEVSAYAQTDRIEQPHVGSSWWEMLEDEYR